MSDLKRKGEKRTGWRHNQHSLKRFFFLHQLSVCSSTIQNQKLHSKEKYFWRSTQHKINMLNLILNPTIQDTVLPRQCTQKLKSVEWFLQDLKLLTHRTVRDARIMEITKIVIKTKQCVFSWLHSHSNPKVIHHKILTSFYKGNSLEPFSSSSLLQNLSLTSWKMNCWISRSILSVHFFLLYVFPLPPFLHPPQKP